MRRTFPLVMGTVLTCGAWAQDWKPTKPVKNVVPIVGSTNDVVARLIAPDLAKAFGQPFIVENKSGAGGNIGAASVAKSDWDAV